MQVIIINGANDCDDKLNYSTEFNTLNINITRVFWVWFGTKCPCLSVRCLVLYLVKSCCSVINALVFNVEFRSLDPDRVVSSKESSSRATAGNSNSLNLSAGSVGAGDGGLNSGADLGLELVEDESDEGRLVNSWSCWGNWSSNLGGCCLDRCHSNIVNTCKRSSPWSRDISHFNCSLLDISGLSVTLRSSLVSDCDKSTSAVNIVIFSLDISSIPGLLMGHVGLGLVIGNLVSIFIGSIGGEFSVVFKLLLLSKS